MKTIITTILLISLLILSCEKDIEDTGSIITMEPIELSPSEQSVDTLYPVCVIADFPDSKLEDMNSYNSTNLKLYNHETDEEKANK